MPLEPLDPAAAPLPCSGTDPAGYLQAVSALLAGGGFDALLPTHEQAWLFAVARDRLPPAAPVTLAPAEAFARVHSKAAFAFVVALAARRSWFCYQQLFAVLPR